MELKTIDVFVQPGEVVSVVLGRFELQMGY